MDEEVYALYKSTRVVLAPFRELCVELVPGQDLMLSSLSQTEYSNPMSLA